MSDDPFEARRRGQRRVRTITAWVAGLAAAGTGAVAVAVAAPSTSSATSGTPTVQNPGVGTSDGSGSFTDDGGTGFQAPSQLPGGTSGSGGFGGFGGGHASSGGS